MRLARCGVRDVAPLKQLAAVMFSLAMAYVSPAAAQGAATLGQLAIGLLFAWRVGPFAGSAR